MEQSQREKIDFLLARFVEAMTAWNWSSTTRRSYNLLARLFVDWLDAETDVSGLEEVTPATVSSYQISLLSQKSKKGRPLSVASQALRLCAVKAFFSFLAREGLLSIDPAKSIELPKRRSSLPQSFLTPKEAIRLIEALDATTLLGLRDRAILEVLYCTGIRNAELRGLSIADFDRSSGVLLIRAGKGNKDRLVPLGPVATEVVADYIAQRV